MDIERTIIALDAEYQDAVRRNDADAIARLLPLEFILVTGRGKVFTRSDLILEASEQIFFYERQEDSEQRVRVYADDVAVITALLWCKGTERGAPFDYKLWFSDTYLRRPEGWRYTFAQSSVPMPVR